ncbi:unnamed protein product [Bemisia tabaci]|uniref:UNC93-like protein MFSD11 n=1 Tax=Bemisia tabaci TaxID=7038 RepID=A0A9P0A3I0_BEMTA|nr:unnamed protein product [Bemisia tabaci]
MNSEAVCKKRDFNLVYLGICFLVLTLSTNAVLSIQEALLAGDGHGGQKGYVCLAIDCAFLSLSLWLGPSILTVTGVKVSLIIGALGDVLYSAAFYFDDVKIIYPICATNGLTHALLWTAQGTYLIENSSPKTIARDTSVFWLVICAAPIVGNVVLFFLLDKKAKVDTSTRYLILNVLIGIAFVAVVLFCFIRPAASEDSAQKKKTRRQEGFWEALVKSWKVFIDKDMLLLTPIFCFSGMQMSYSNVIFITSVGFTLNLTTYSKQLVPLSGIFIGFGVIFGGIVQYLCKKKCKFDYERSLFLSAGQFCYIISFVLTVLNFPNDAVFGDTENVGIVFNSVPICLLASFMIGVGQMYTLSNTTNLVAVMFRQQSSQCSAIFNFVKFGASGMTYFYCQFLGLHYQVAILASFGIVGLILFLVVDARTVNKLKSENEKQPEEQEFMPKEHATTMIIMSSNTTLSDLRFSST